MKEKVLRNIVIGILFLIGIPFFIVLASEFTGVGKKEGGFKTYPIYSPIKEGQDFIIQNKIKCIAKDVETVAFVDVSRGETFFAYNIDHNNYFIYENIKYEKVPRDIIDKYQFTVHFNWIEVYGKYIINSIFGICIIVPIIGWLWGRRK